LARSDFGEGATGGRCQIQGESFVAGIEFLRISHTELQLIIQERKEALPVRLMSKDSLLLAVLVLFLKLALGLQQVVHVATKQSAALDVNLIGAQADFFRLYSLTVATQSISMSNGPAQATTHINMRAGGTPGK